MDGPTQRGIWADTMCGPFRVRAAAGTGIWRRRRWGTVRVRGVPSAHTTAVVRSRWAGGTAGACGAGARGAAERIGESAVRLLFTTNPSLGHFHPLVPLAAAARRRGHEVRFASAALLAPAVERAGFRLEAAGAPYDGGLAARFPELVALPPAERADFAWRRNFADYRAASMVPDLLAIGRAWRPDLFVREDAELGACVAAEVLGVPHAA